MKDNYTVFLFCHCGKYFWRTVKSVPPWSKFSHFFIPKKKKRSIVPSIVCAIIIPLLFPGKNLLLTWKLLWFAGSGGDCSFFVLFCCSNFFTILFSAYAQTCVRRCQTKEKEKENYLNRSCPIDNWKTTDVFVVHLATFHQHHDRRIPVAQPFFTPDNIPSGAGCLHPCTDTPARPLSMT